MNRIRLTFTRNKDENTKAYRVFRAVHPKVTRKDTLVMEIEHPTIPKPVYIEGDVLQRQNPNIYRANHPSIMMDDTAYPIQVFLNDINIQDLGITYTLDYEKGEFIFSASFNEGDVVQANYYSDAIRVYDTDEVDQPNVKYYGPVARDRTEGSIPSNVSLVPDQNRVCVVLTWDDASTTGQQYYYRIEAIDEYGNFSNLSQERSAFLKEGLDNTGYLVERSFDNVNWHTIARQGARDYTEYGIPLNPPGPVPNLQANVVLKHGNSVADVVLSWDAAPPGQPSASPYYRVRSVSALGSVSQPSLVVGPVYLTSAIDRYVVRRKIWDGSYPTYNGSDAITIAQLDPGQLSFTDLDVPDNTTYTYAVYTVDRAGNYSLASAIDANVGDATSPAPVVNITVKALPYII